MTTAKTAAPKKKAVPKKKKAPVSKPSAAKAPAPKKKPAAKKPAAKKPAAKTTQGTAPVALSFNGVNLELGDVAKGGSAAKGLVTQLAFKQLNFVSGFNPRARLGDLDDLAASIKAEGILQAFLVRPGKSAGMFDVLDGFRRGSVLKAAKYTGHVPCVVRADLVGDEDRARAVAVAINSEGTRSNLNIIDMGRVCRDLVKNGWALPRVARETGQHISKVRRALKLLEQPASVQKQLADGTISLRHGLELAKIPEAERVKVAGLLAEAADAKAVRAIRKSAEVKALASGKKSPANKGTPTSRKTTNWRGGREKSAMLRYLCHAFTSEDEDLEKGSVTYHEVRGAIGLLLWDRGDIDSPHLYDEDPSANEDPKLAKKELAVFNKFVGNEAAAYVPDADD